MIVDAHIHYFDSPGFVDQLLRDMDGAGPRISLVLGFPLKQGNSFLAGLYARLAASQAVSGSTCEIRTPVDVLTLCDAVYELFDLDYSGLLHIGCTGSISRFELSRMLAQKMGFAPSLVVPSGEAGASRAPRHRNGILDVRKARAVLHSTKLLTVEQTVGRALITMKAEELYR